MASRLPPPSAPSARGHDHGLEFGTQSTLWNSWALTLLVGAQLVLAACLICRRPAGFERIQRTEPLSPTISSTGAVEDPPSAADTHTHTHSQQPAPHALQTDLSGTCGAHRASSPVAELAGAPCASCPLRLKRATTSPSSTVPAASCTRPLDLYIVPASDNAAGLLAQAEQRLQDRILAECLAVGAGAGSGTKQSQ